MTQDTEVNLTETIERDAFKDDFDEVLRQMRARRITACEAAKTKKREEMTRAALMERSDHSYSSRGDDFAMYWKRIRSGRTAPAMYWKRIRSGRAAPALRMNDNSSSSTSPTSVKTNFEEQILSNIQGAISGRTEPRESVFGKHEACAKKLQYTQEDLADLIMKNDGEFARLQQSLRNYGAVTNELLKQSLPFVIQHSQNAAKLRQTAKEGMVVPTAC